MYLLYASKRSCLKRKGQLTVSPAEYRMMLEIIFEFEGPCPSLKVAGPPLTNEAYSYSVKG